MLTEAKKTSKEPQTRGGGEVCTDISIFSKWQQQKKEEIPILVWTLLDIRESHQETQIRSSKQATATEYTFRKYGCEQGTCLEVQGEGDGDIKRPPAAGVGAGNLSGCPSTPRDPQKGPKSKFTAHTSPLHGSVFYSTAPWTLDRGRGGLANQWGASSGARDPS